jgi:hypothetical protein
MSGAQCEEGGCAKQVGLLMPEWWTAIWEWIQSLHGGAPPFLGSLTGSLLGLLGILAGALFNAHLNRRRDARLRREEARLMIAALRAELSRLRDTLINNAERLETESPADFYVPDVAHSIKLFPELISKLGLIGEDAAVP